RRQTPKDSQRSRAGHPADRLDPDLPAGGGDPAAIRPFRRRQPTAGVPGRAAG
nr:hypothetical protein [Tanacetum cinerariifolium]